MSVPAYRRRPPRTGPTVDLFPFLGIIVCVIGIVILLVSGLIAAGSIRETTARHARELQARIDRVQRWLALESTRPSASATQDQIETDAAAERLVRKVETDTHALESELARLRAAVARAEKEAARGDLTLTQSIDGGGVARAPVFVECTATGFTLYTPRTGGLRAETLTLAALTTTPRFAQVLTDVAARAKRGETAVINFLVRPDGIEAYRRALALTRDAEAPWAAAPLLASARIHVRSPSAP